MIEINNNTNGIKKQCKSGTVKMKSRSGKKGSAKVYAIIALIIVLAVIYMIIRFNWKKFKVEANLWMTIALIVIVVLAIVILYIRHKIRKARKQKEKERKEQEKLAREAAAKAEGEDVKESTLGNGKFEVSDITEAAGKVGEKISGMVNKEDR